SPGWYESASKSPQRSVEHGRQDYGGKRGKVVGQAILRKQPYFCRIAVVFFRPVLFNPASTNPQNPPLPPPLFLPTARQTNWLLVVAFLSVGQALYLRYMAIENLNVELACQGGLKTWLCTAFHVSIALYNHYVFGVVALAAALLNLMRPSLVLVA